MSRRDFGTILVLWGVVCMIGLGITEPEAVAQAWVPSFTVILVIGVRDILGV